MAERKPIHIEPDSEIATLLEQAEDRPITLESGGMLFHLEREKRATIETYDPAKALAALQRSAGALAGIDIEKFKKEILEQRSQDSIGRPDH